MSERKIATESSLRKLLARAGRYANAGRFSEAREMALRLGRTAGQHAAILIEAGRLLSAMGHHTEAVNCYRSAVRAAPGDPEGWIYLSDAEAGVDNFGTALSALSEGHRRGGGAPDISARIASRLPPLLSALDAYDTDAAQLAETVLGSEGVDPVPMLHAVVSLLLKDQKIAALAGNDEEADRLDILSGNRLLRALMEVTIVANARLETVLTQARRSAFERFIESGTAGLARTEGFLISLARQNHLNEYAHWSSPVEANAPDRLDAAILETGPEATSAGALVALRASYGRLSDSRALPVIQDIVDRSASAGLARLWREQVLDPRAEEALARDFPDVGTIDHATSRAVRQQYEQSPYPRWARLGYQEPRDLRRELSQQLPALPVSNLSGLPDAPEILIAGCGTGQHPLTLARRLPDAHFTALDLSRASLAYAARKAEELGLTNISFLHADILGLNEWGRDFDIVESVGVLHHMAVPLEGWRILANLLRPGGWMKIGLYSRTARGYVRRARERIAAAGYVASNTGIRDFRHEVIAGGPGHPLTDILRAYDFYSLSNCRDMFFHVQEHQFTIPEIERAIDDLGLEFMGFQLADAAWMTAYRERYPEDPTLRSLRNWDALEAAAPRLFAAMYAFWVRKGSCRAATP